jgi:ribosomal protein S12 methylthiotransferase
MCSYCAIPIITGRHVPRPEDELLREAEWLAQQGVKELNVIAQDLSSYGLDIYHEHRLPALVKQLAAIEGIQWIRLHYAYPTDFPYDLLQVMADEKKVCRYLDIALQHNSDHMLQLMRRHITSQEQDALIERIRRDVPGIYLRTTLIVGHPGETEEDFASLKEWVRQMRFERMGAFAYSHEEGTYAYRHYKDDIPEEVKQERLQELMAVQQDIAEAQQQQLIGQTLPVLIDRQEGDWFIGRTEHDSPEVDNEVLIENTYPLKVGRFYPVTITQAEAFDLYGQPQDTTPGKGF